jgi:aminotransferase
MREALSSPIRISNRLDAVRFSLIRRLQADATGLAASGVDILRLELGEPDFPTPRHIRDAAAEALENGHTHYTPNAGLPSLREAIARKLARDNSIRVNPESQIIVTVGANEAIAATLLAVLNPGDQAIILTPAWPHYEYAIRLAGATPVPLRTELVDRFVPDLDALEGLVTGRTRLMIINTPNNPTGTIYDDATLRGIAAIADRHNLLVISDEIYERIVFDGLRPISLASLPGMESRTVTVNGFSKTYAMTGWRLGYAAGPASVMEAMLRVHQYTVTCAPSFAQVAATVALDSGQESVHAMVNSYNQRRGMVLAALASVEGCEVLNPKGSFYAFPRLTSQVESSVTLSAILLNDYHVATSPGQAFGTGDEPFIRVAFTESEERLRIGLPRLTSGLAAIARL